MKRAAILSFALALALLPGVASAQTVASPVPDADEYLDYLGGSGVGGLFGAPSEVGPYRGKFQTPPSYNFSLFCVDYLNNAADGWVMSTRLGVGQLNANMGNTKLGVGSLATYRQAAYLASLFDSWATYIGVPYTTNFNTTTVSTKNQVWSAIQVAIWEVMYPGVNGFAGNQGLSGYVTGLAAAAVGGGWKADRWYVLTPETATANSPTGTPLGVIADRQEFLVRTVVPEPSTYLLLATGLLFLVAFSRKRFLGRGNAA